MKNLTISLMLSLSIAIFLPQTTQAQKSNSVENWVTEFATTYSLDKKQQVRLRTIATQYDENLDDLRKVRRRDRQLYLRKMRVLRLNTESLLKKMMRDDQWAAYELKISSRKVQEDKVAEEKKQSGQDIESTQQALLKLEDDYRVFGN